MMQVLIVGRTGGTHVGHSLHRAAGRIGVDAGICDSGEAYDAPWWLTALNWHLLGHRPPYLGTFSQNVLDQVSDVRPDVLLTTGMAPVRAAALREIGNMGVKRLNFSTDDPWNPNHNASWFLDALREYDTVFTPRRANIDEVRDLGCEGHYLPFGYDPALFHPVDLTSAEREELHAEALFVGGADDDRASLLEPLLKSDVDVALYGGYWENYSIAADAHRGWAPPEEILKATRAADVALCLVRRANRDGHVMRSLEIPAIGACMLAEDTDEHRTLFGEPGDNVHYFRSPGHIVEQVNRLLASPRQRQRLAENVHQHIVGGEHTYADRLQTMLELA